MYEFLNSFVNTAKKLSKNDDIEIEKGSLEVAASIYAAVVDAGVQNTDDSIPEPERSIRDEFVDMHLLANIIAYRLLVGDLKLIDVADNSGKRAYYEKLIAEVKKRIILVT